MAFSKLFARFKRTAPQTQPLAAKPATRVDPQVVIAEQWAAGIAPEIAFWDTWLATGGQPWPEDFQYRCTPDAELEERIANALVRNAGSVVQMLDVGAGPLTALGKRWAGHTLQITAIDPLAAEYEQLLQKHHLPPLVRTQRGFAERLVEQFGPEQFDLVYARNCIDHSYDPCHAIQQMVAVTKRGGLVYLYHGINEAEVQQYHGFHQWNLFCKGDALYLGNLQQEINMSALLKPVADVACEIVYEHNWMVNLIRKR